MTDTLRSRRKAASALLIIPAILFALSACAPSAGGDASDGASGTTGSGGNGNSKYSSLFDYTLAYNECMRGEGFDMPDPKEGEGNVAMKADPNTDMDALQAAGGKCMKELGAPPPPSAEEKADADKQMLEWATKAAECYRENGYDMPDPKAGELPEFPADAPEDVQTECGGGAGSVTRKMN